eukprot:480170-Rhodomonas_salina.1
MSRFGEIILRGLASSSFISALPPRSRIGSCEFKLWLLREGERVRGTAAGDPRMEGMVAVAFEPARKRRREMQPMAARAAFGRCHRPMAVA